MTFVKTSNLVGRGQLTGMDGSSGPLQSTRYWVASGVFFSVPEGNSALFDEAVSEDAEGPSSMLCEEGLDIVGRVEPGLMLARTLPNAVSRIRREVVIFSRSTQATVEG